MEPEQSTTGAPIQSGENESNRPLSRFHYHYHQCNDCALPIGDPWRAGNGTAECSRKPARPVRSSSARWRISKRTSPTFCHTHIGFIITVIRSLQSFIVQITFFFFFSFRLIPSNWWIQSIPFQRSVNKSEPQIKSFASLLGPSMSPPRWEFPN